MEWRRINGYDYSVSDNGQVRNDLTGHILKPFPCGYDNAYLGVDLCNGSKKRYKVHRLVAKAFIPRGYGPDASRRNEVNHKDLNPHNNNVGNLEWCDRFENEQHKIACARAKDERERYEKFMHAHEDIPEV